MLQGTQAAEGHCARPYHFAAACIKQLHFRHPSELLQTKVNLNHIFFRSERYKRRSLDDTLTCSNTLSVTKHDLLRSRTLLRHARSWKRPLFLRFKPENNQNKFRESSFKQVRHLAKERLS
jgi:hypothetical protein